MFEAMDKTLGSFLLYQSRNTTYVSVTSGGVLCLNSLATKSDRMLRKSGRGYIQTSKRVSIMAVYL